MLMSKSEARMRETKFIVYLTIIVMVGLLLINAGLAILHPNVLQGVRIIMSILCAVLAACGMLFLALL
jgi:hypothetical protein